MQALVEQIRVGRGGKFGCGEKERSCDETRDSWEVVGEEGGEVLLGVEDGRGDGGGAGGGRGGGEEEGEVDGAVEVEGERAGRGWGEERGGVLMNPSEGGKGTERQWVYEMDVGRRRASPTYWSAGWRSPARME